jgi:uncharacterized protein (TIGR00255 family)
MTGYARGVAVSAAATVTIELKTVNGRGLDMRLRLPGGFDFLETEIRRQLGAAITRGSVTASLTLDRAGTGGDLVVNQQALDTVLAAMEQLRGRIDAAPPSLDGILAIHGVLEQRGNAADPAQEEALGNAVQKALADAIAGLLDVRHTEGRGIGTVLSGHLDEIAALIERAASHPSRTREAVLARLRQHLSELAADIAIDQERLAQEALLLTTKADISEELDRLRAHVDAARKLVADGGPVGRKLDFLAQEFNREANTLCSKANAVELTAIGLDLKAVIDQLREQVQNIE